MYLKTMQGSAGDQIFSMSPADFFVTQFGEQDQNAEGEVGNKREVVQAFCS
jgi:hypothetical protein